MAAIGDSPIDQFTAEVRRRELARRLVATAGILLAIRVLTRSR